MKQISLFIVLIASLQISHAQVGINTTDPKAQLDISAGMTPSEMDGLLIPRLDDFPAGVGTDQNGMLVFMTGGGAPTKGFYYWDNGIPAWVFFQGSASSDSDWFVSNTTAASNNINDNIYTLGGVSIGTNTAASNSTLYIATDLANSNGIYTQTENGTTESMVAINNISTLDGTGDYRAISNNLGGTTSGNNIAITNTITNDGAGSKTAVLNSISSDFGERIGLQNSFFAGAGNATGVYNVITNGTQDGIIHGVRNTITAAGNGRRYGIRNDISGTGTGIKYGTYNRIGNTSGGIHYGVYSDVQKATGYAGYFIGRTSIGIGTSNRYLLPETDGTAGQVITTDGSGQLSFNSIEEDGSGNDWTITGNTGTDPTSNFIGTIDAQDLSFRTQNTEKIRITTQGQIETYNTGSSVFIGESAGANDDLANRQNIAIGYNALRDNITGARNIGIGSGALYASTGGTANIAIGDDAMVANESGNSNVGLGIQTLFKNTIGNNNTAYGGTAMRENTEGSNNTALGFRALYNNTTTNGNVAVGFDAGFENITGTNNTYLGFNSGHLNLGDRSIFIGANSGSNELGSDKLYIENSNADADNALIYGEFDTNILRTNGTLQIGNPSGTGYAFPTADGTLGQVMTTDGTGNITFATPATYVEKIDDLLDGKSDNDGSENGSSIFLGINAGAVDDSSNNGNVGIGYLALEDNTEGSLNTAIGYNALLNNIDGVANTAVGSGSLDANTNGEWNTAIGQSALSANVDGAYNTAVGRGSLALNVDGNSNVALGVNAYGANSSGNFNTVIGVDAATGLTASSNTIIGRRAMNSYSAGGENVAIGAGTGYYGSGIQNTFIGTSAGNQVGTGERNGSVFLGYGAGTPETTSNKLYIENSASATPLIYGEFDNNIARVNGELQVGDPTGTGYALPTNQGAANEVLTSNGDGTTTWAAGGATMAQVMANPKHPDGFLGFTPITHQLGSGNYTVPTGKNLYITMYTPLGVPNLQINGVIIVVIGNNQPFSKLPNPIIAGPGDVVSIPSSNGLFNGYLVDANVTPITQDISSTSYTIPANKTLVVLSVSSDTALSSNRANYLINGDLVYFGKGNAYSNTTGFFGPIFLGEGDIFSADNNASFNGYLIDN